MPVLRENLCLEVPSPKILLPHLHVERQKDEMTAASLIWRAYHLPSFNRLWYSCSAFVNSRQTRLRCAIASL